MGVGCSLGYDRLKREQFRGVGQRLVLHFGISMGDSQVQKFERQSEYEYVLLEEVIRVAFKIYDVMFGWL